MKKLSLLLVLCFYMSCGSETEPLEDSEDNTPLTASQKIEGNWTGWGASFYLPNNYNAEDAAALNQPSNSDRRNYTFSNDGTGTGYVQPRISDVAVTCEDASQIFNLFDWEVEEVADRETLPTYYNYPSENLYFLYIRPYIERGVRCRKTIDVGNCLENLGEWLPCESNRPERLIIYFENDDEFRIVNTIFDPEIDLNVTYNFYRN